MNKSGIKESKELMSGLLELSLVLIDVFKDGVQAKDAIELWYRIGKDEVLKDKFEAAFEGYKKIPSELNDLDVYESVELMQCLITFVPKFIESLQKKK